MTLEQLAEEYKVSAGLLRTRLSQVKKLIEEGQSNSEMLMLRRRATILADMARETAAIGNYLAGYYGGREGNGEKLLAEGRRISGAESLRERGGRAGRLQIENDITGLKGGTDAAPEGDAALILC